jgi:acyl-CoA thioester hydrolase
MSAHHERSRAALKHAAAERVDEAARVAAHSTFRFPVRVYYEDTDAAGVVYYANYLKFMERARTEWLSSLGFDLAVVEREHGIVFAVHRVEIDFRKPAQLSDRLDVTLTLVEIRRARLVADQAVKRNAEILTHARVTLACLDPSNWRPARIPAPLAARMEALP